MALVVADRVQETTTTTGTGTYTLAGAKDGFQSFAAVGDGNTTYYACTDGTDYEVGIGTYTLSGTTLARTTIIESSNSDAAVNWGAGEKDIFVTLPASKAIFEDASNNVAIGNNITVGGTVDGVDIATNIPSTLGTAGQVLTVNSGGTAGEWASLPSASLAQEEFTATSGQTVFTVTGGITDANNVSVYLNGAKLFSTDVTISAAANTVTLATGAATGDLVTVTEVAGASGGGGASAFTGLSDTPSSLGTAGQILQVNSGATALEFADASSGSGVTVHANQAAMLTDAASASEGSLHYETDNNRLYVKQSSGFYLLASITNASPTIDSFSENTGGAGANNLTAGGTFTLTAGSDTVVTINATEPDLETISYSATVTSGTATDVFSSPSFPVTNQSSNVFTLTPVTSGSGKTVTIRFDASDGTNVANVSHSFAFVIADSHYTTLLMATDGSAGDNNDIIDSSSSSHTITVNGDAHAGTFSPYRHGGYSTYFDGNDYLAVTKSTDLDLDTNNWTIECWLNLTNPSALQAVYSFGYETQTTRGCLIYLYNGNLHFAYSTTGSNNTDTSMGSHGIVANEWTHLSVVRNGSTITGYINGAALGTTINIGASDIYYPTSGNVRIASDGSNFVTGYISDFRLVNGTAITPASGGPTERLTAVTNTKLLTCHLPYISDGSSSAHSITVSGDPETKPFGPYDYNEYSKSINGGSVYFNGSSDWLTGPTSLLNLTIANASSQAATIEAWVYHKGRTSPANSYHNQAIIGKGDVYLNMGLNGSGNVTFYHYDGTARTFTSTGTVPLNTWTHVAATISGGTVTLYINGSADATTGTWYGIASAGQNQAVTLGRASTNASSNYFNGYISDLRVIEGTATAPASGGPTERLTDVSGTGYSTSILTCHLPYIADGSSNGHSITVNGDPETKPFGPYDYEQYSKSTNGGSVYFDGSGDYLSIADDADFDLGTGDFTFEAWAYPTALSYDYPSIISAHDGSASTSYIFGLTNTNKMVLYGGSGGIKTSTATFPLNTWVHLMATRSSGTVRFFINGTLDSTTYTDNGSYDCPSTGLKIGQQAVGSGATLRNFTGYLSDVRLIKGQALQTSTFDPPTAPLSAVTNTSLLVSGTDAHVIDKSQVSNLKLFNDAASTAAQAKFSNTASVSFDGTGDYVTATAGDLGDGDFSVEYWVRYSSFYNYITTVSTTRGSTGWSAGTQASAQIVWYSSSAEKVRGSATMSTNTWHHVAFTRENGTMRGFLDGTQDGTSNSDTSNFSDTDLNIGRLQSGSEYTTGYIQDLRITKGLARHVNNSGTYTYPVPSAPLKG